MVYELVKFDHDLPVKIIMHPVSETCFIPRHWHESVEISYVLSGTIETIYIEGTNYKAEQGDITVINSNEVHSFFVNPQKDSSALTLIISYDFLKANCPDIDRIAFQCISSVMTEEEQLLKFQQLRKILDAFVAIYRDYEADPLAPIKIKGLSYELIYLLLKDFAVEKKHVRTINTHKHLNLLTEITDFIKSHYNHPLSIESISTHFRFTPEYLCRFFRKHIGMTILQYINSIRLEKSLRDLVMTDHSVTQIAFENGFPNVKSFNRVFKAVYIVTPDQYRKSKQQRT